MTDSNDIKLTTHSVPLINTETGERESINIVAKPGADPATVARSALSEWDENVFEVDEERILESDSTGPDVIDSGEEVADHSTDHVAGEYDPDQLLAESARLYRSKNDDYGDAWRLAGETMAMWAEHNGIDEINPTDPAQMVSLNLFIQRLHKLIRVFNLEFGGIEPSNEDVVESHQDEGVYAHLHASHAAHRNYSDQD